MSLGSNEFRIIHLGEVDSTNSCAARDLASLADRDVLVAETQTAGRGRMGRTWLADVPGNIYMTLVLKPARLIDPSLPLVNLTQYLSVVLCQELQGQGVKASIKWPNDVQVEGKKICGLLAECRVSGQQLLGVLIGAGINLNMPVERLAAIHQPATSLNLLLGRPIDRDRFLHRLLVRFFEGYATFLTDGFPSIAAEYRTRSPGLGRTITLNLPTGPIQGVAEGIAQDGSLELRLPDGTTGRFSLGEVSQGWR
jgi:BirA family biotin operon repressor/biotin-[acetyl-CoA-carboxylase] ligase